mmetsp:Transcript_8620/g.23274  ORF Transcript_8620/g.23274 Transcript_8620/m.23274 type:complete len:312 (-) Transcript_8620:749-1684(-)
MHLKIFLALAVLRMAAAANIRRSDGRQLQLGGALDTPTAAPTEDVAPTPAPTEEGDDETAEPTAMPTEDADEGLGSASGLTVGAVPTGAPTVEDVGDDTTSEPTAEVDGTGESPTPSPSVISIESIEPTESKQAATNPASDTESPTAAPSLQPTRKKTPPTQSPTPRPTHKMKTHRPTTSPTRDIYIPPDVDPIKDEDEDSDSADNWNDDKTANNSDYETLAEMEKDRNVLIALAIVFGVGIILALATAHQMLENPDGCCASICRIFVACFCAILRCVCFPCRTICGCTGSSNRQTHELVDNTFTNDLELT